MAKREFHATRMAPLAPEGALSAVLTPAMLEQASMDLLATPENIVRQFDDVQCEMDGLKSELNLLRRRDETLNFYMHRLDEELRLAARLQQDFLPKALPTLGNVRFHTLFRPAGYVSGDLYDVMRVDEKRVGFYIADAVGHGMPAALLTMFIKHALVTKEVNEGTYRLLKPSEALGRLHEAILEQHLSQATFATAIYGLIDVQTLEVTMACAGHPAPVLLRDGAELSALAPDGGLLGIFPGETYSDYTTRLLPGDRLVLYTDGIEVAFCDDPATGNPDHWRGELLARRHLPCDRLIREFAEAAAKASGSLEPKDDLTMVIVEALALANDTR